MTEPAAERMPERTPELVASPMAPADSPSYYPGSGDLAHPGPASVRLSREIRHAIVRHARASLPNEACGLVIGDRPAPDGGEAARWLPLRNALESPFRYEIAPEDLLRVTIETERADEAIWAIVHSHVASPARPSPTDVRQSLYPEALYVLVSLDPAEADPLTGAEGIRAWRIVDGTVHEVTIVDEPMSESLVDGTVHEVTIVDEPMSESLG